MTRRSSIVRFALVGLITGIALSDPVSAATITKVTGTAKVAAGVGEGIQTFWTYLLGLIPLIGVAAIVFGLWNAITTDRGQSSSTVSGLSVAGVGLVIALVPMLITTTFTTSGSEAATFRSVVAAPLSVPMLDWESPVTFLIMMGIPIWRVLRLAKRQPVQCPPLGIAA